MKSYIAMKDCKKGYLYRIDSRNLGLGVYDGNEGFIGIRTKFGDRYLFTEFHHDQGAPYGTVLPIEELEKVPDHIPIVDHGDGPIDMVTRRKVAFDKSVREGGRGWYFMDTGEASDAIRPISTENLTLFNYLDSKRGQIVSE